MSRDNWIGSRRIDRSYGIWMGSSTDRDADFCRKISRKTWNVWLRSEIEVEINPANLFTFCRYFSLEEKTKGKIVREFFFLSFLIF